MVKMKTISKYFFKLLYSSSLKLFLHSDCTGKAFFSHKKVPWNFILLTLLPLGGGHYVPADFLTLFFSKFQLKTMVRNFLTFNMHE